MNNFAPGAMGVKLRYLDENEGGGISMYSVQEIGGQGESLEYTLHATRSQALAHAKFVASKIADARRLTIDILDENGFSVYYCAPSGQLSKSPSGPEIAEDLRRFALVMEG